MKPIIAIVLFLALSQVARGQDTIIADSSAIPIPISYMDYNPPLTLILTWPILLSKWDEWVDSCKRDTIHAVPYEGEYLVDHGSYREMVSERQLEDRGYRFKYRWITNTIQPFEWDYVFLREPTLSGFMEFIRRTK